MVMGWALLKMYEHAPAYVMALSAGFLLMGPFLALGLYRVSQRLEAGEKPDFGDSLLAWDRRTGEARLATRTVDGDAGRRDRRLAEVLAPL